MVRVSHNKNILIWIIVLLILLFGFAYYASSINDGDGNEDNDGFDVCRVDSDCIPLPVCHPDSCIFDDGFVEKVENVLCTADCRPGTLDCGQGHCSCVDGECVAVIE